MRYLALDFETGNASPLSACALGASVFEDNQLVDREKSRSSVRRNAWAGSTGAMSASTTSRRRWSRTHRRSPRCRGPSSPTSRRAASSCATTLCSIRMCFAAVWRITDLKMPECRYLCTVKVSKRVWPELENHKLDTVSAALHIDLNHHEAGSDARAAGRSCRRLCAGRAARTPTHWQKKSACGSAGFPRWGKRRAASPGTPNPGSTGGQRVRVIR